MSSFSVTTAAFDGPVDCEGSPSWPTTLDSSSRLPKPGAYLWGRHRRTARSIQTTEIMASVSVQEMSSVPLSDDRQPYLTELVASSWTISARLVAVLSPTPMRGTATRMRPLNAPRSS